MLCSPLPRCRRKLGRLQLRKLGLSLVIRTAFHGLIWVLKCRGARSPQLRYMSPEALKILHSRFHLFKPSDDTTWNWFPYAALRAFEKAEVAAGRPPIFITATYMGKKRPVVWNWSLGLQGQTSGVPKTPSSNWEYAVNVADRSVH